MDPPLNSTQLSQTSIQNRLNQLIGSLQNLHQVPVLKLLTPKIIELKLQLHSSNLIEVNPLWQLKEILYAFERFDFSELDRLKIILNGFEDKIEGFHYSQIKQSLNVLTAKQQCCIDIQQSTTENNEWNPFSFYQFTSFDFEKDAFPFSYEFKNQNIAITMSQQIEEKKNLIEFDILNLSQMSQQCAIFTRFFKRLLSIRQQEQQYSNLIDQRTNLKINKEKFLDSNLQTTNQKLVHIIYIINISDEFSTLSEQIVSVSNILQYLNPDLTHIDEINLHIQKCQYSNSRSVLENIIGHPDFAGIKLFSKVKINFNFMQQNHLDFLSFFKECKIYFPQSTDVVQNLILKPNEVRLDNLDILKATSEDLGAFIPICNFVRSHCSNLRKFQYLSTQKLQIDLPMCLKKILQLAEITNLNQINFDHEIIYHQNNLLIHWSQRKEELDKMSVIFPEIITSFKKAISIVILFPRLSDKQELIVFLLKLLELRQVTGISISTFSRGDFGDVNRIMIHRKSIYHSLVAYDMFIRMFMQYHPVKVLFDLYDDCY